MVSLCCLINPLLNKHNKKKNWVESKMERSFSRKSVGKLLSTSYVTLRCLRCAALLALRCAALRCVALLYVALLCSALLFVINVFPLRVYGRPWKRQLSLTCTCLCFRRVSYLLERVPRFAAASAPKRTSSDLNFLSSNMLQRGKTRDLIHTNSSLPRMMEITNGQLKRTL